MKSLVSLVLLFLCASLSVAGKDEVRSPNFVVIFTDDQGYNDLGCFGSKLIKTPRIDRMAKEGIKLTSFYTGAPVCGPSRAALLTGCYPIRVAEATPNKNFHTILHEDEVTVAEQLKNAGYATMAIGKWHVAGSGGQAIGTDNSKQGLERFFPKRPKLMPWSQGFDRYYGIPYSNDMKPSVLFDGEKAAESPVDQVGISTRYTDKAIEFVTENKDKPFFLYLAHAMPHTPLWPSQEFEGKSAYGYYGDCIEEIDWNVGRFLDRIKELGIDRDTLVIYTSDNGPWLEEQRKRTPDVRRSRLQSGTAEPLRGFKMTTWEGGPRVPCVMRWPGRIPPGRTSDEILTAMDFMTTFCDLAGVELPKGRMIDGKDMMPLLSGKADRSPHEAYYYYKHDHLLAVRSGKWKLVLPRPAKPKVLGWYGRLQEAVKETTLYDLENDMGETKNVAEAHPDVVARLMEHIEAARKDLGDHKLRGAGVRHGR